ncbi:MAG: hypothetical protein ACRD3J_08735 [Thermoanaerobaculia bacterium]
MNTIYRVNLSSGVIGLMGTSRKRALSACLSEVNQNGEELVFVLPDQTNIFQFLVHTLILVLTLFLWCPAPGYLLITRPRFVPTAAERLPERLPQANTVCPQCNKSYPGDLRGQFCEACGNSL